MPETGADEHERRIAVGESSHDTGTTPNFLHDAFKAVVRAQAFFRCPSHPASLSVCAGHKKRLTAIELVMRRGLCLWFVFYRLASRPLPDSPKSLSCTESAYAAAAIGISSAEETEEASEAMTL